MKPRVLDWWRYGSRPAALDCMDFGPDHECWYLDDAPWHVVYGVLVLAMCVLAGSA